MLNLSHEEFYRTVVNPLHTLKKSDVFMGRAYTCHNPQCREIRFLNKEDAIPNHHKKPMQAIHDVYRKKNGELVRFPIN